jgi:hypothetical protein
MADIPNSLLLAFERGHAFHSICKIAIDKWDGHKFEMYDDEEGCRHMTMKQAAEILEASDKFDFVIFDTADMAVKKCTDYWLNKLGHAHLQDAGDFGKGYDLCQNTPFRQLVGAILATGRGIGLITHSNITTTNFAKGAKSKRETTLPGGIHKFLHTQADIILHGSFGARRPNSKHRERILQTEGDEETLAGNRTKGINLPPKFIVDYDNPWKQWCEFFKDPKAADKATLALNKSKNEDSEEVATLQVEEEEEVQQPVKKGKK